MTEHFKAIDVPKGKSIKMGPDRKSYVIENVGETYNYMDGKIRKRSKKSKGMKKQRRLRTIPRLWKCSYIKKTCRYQEE